jgi:hypothetical protein
MTDVSVRKYSQEMIAGTVVLIQLYNRINLIACI